TLGIIPHMTAAIIGLAALLHASALAFQTLKYLGVAYLLYMAWNALREQGALRVEKEIGTRSAMQVITTAILINILNPKLSIFFYAFLPQFVSASEPHPLARMFELSTVFMLLTFAVFIGYGLFAASIRKHVTSRPRVLTWMRRTFAGAFVALGVKLAPGARTAWHTHPLGQTLIVTAGFGLAQRWGGPIEQIRPGDVIWFPPGEKHWHGATATTAITHIAIQEQLDGKTADWMEKVSDEQYQALKDPSPAGNRR